MKTSESPRQLESAEDGAKRLAISPSTLRGWAYKGLVASHKIGTRLLFDTAEINRIIQESERPRLTVAGKAPKQPRTLRIAQTERLEPALESTEQ